MYRFPYFLFYLSAITDFAFEARSDISCYSICMIRSVILVNFLSQFSQGICSLTGAFFVPSYFSVGLGRGIPTPVSVESS